MYILVLENTEHKIYFWIHFKPRWDKQLKQIYSKNKVEAVIIKKKTFQLDKSTFRQIHWGILPDIQTWTSINSSQIIL